MPSGPASPPPVPGVDPATATAGPARASAAVDPATEAGRADLTPAADLSQLPIAGVTRRRVGFVTAAFATAWIVLVFARQAGDAAAATARAEDIRMSNAVLAAEVEGKRRELELIGRQEWIVQQARGYRLGAEHEIPFTLAADAPALPPDAPGSAAVRLGAAAEPPTPLEAWLSLLFGPSR